MSIELEGAIPHVEKTADDWSNGVDKRVVDLALEVSGGTGMFRSSELERLYRDVRCGGFQPANSALVHEIVGKTALGVLADPQRW